MIGMHEYSIGVCLVSCIWGNTSYHICAKCNVIMKLAETIVLCVIQNKLEVNPLHQSNPQETPTFSVQRLKTRDRGWITPHEYLTGDRTLEIFEYGGARGMARKNRTDVSGLGRRS
jgi:hypothetical protein